MKISNRGKIHLIRIQNDSFGETGKENNWKETWGMCLGAPEAHPLKEKEITMHTHAHCGIFYTLSTFALSGFLHTLTFKLPKKKRNRETNWKENNTEIYQILI